MVVEDFIALIVFTLLSLAGVEATLNNSIIYVPSLKYNFLVAFSCLDWVGVALWSLMFTLIFWVYTSLKGLSLSRRAYLAAGFIGFTSFLFANCLRIFLEIYLLTTVYNSVSQLYLSRGVWQAYEGQIGLGLMFTTLTILMVSSHLLTSFFNGRLKYYSKPSSRLHVKVVDGLKFRGKSQLNKSKLNLPSVFRRKVE